MCRGWQWSTVHRCRRSRSAGCTAQGASMPRSRPPRARGRHDVGRARRRVRGAHGVARACARCRARSVGNSCAAASACGPARCSTSCGWRRRQRARIIRWRSAQLRARRDSTRSRPRPRRCTTSRRRVRNVGVAPARARPVRASTRGSRHWHRPSTRSRGRRGCRCARSARRARRRRARPLVEILAEDHATWEVRLFAS